jgi:hypothetical protein
MKIVMTLLARDEADIIEAQIAFHLAAGVDFVVATDHGSQDETTSILERYARRGVLHLRRESAREKRQAEWATRMARMAAVDFGADWVINSDADEFWWPRGGTLKEVLAQIPERFGIVHTFVRPFLPRPGEGPFAESMTVRLTPAAPINNPFGTFRVNTRLLHRGAADVVVGFGNATVRASGLAPLREWSPVEVLHFPIRSLPQFERKFLTKHMTAGGRQRFDTLRLVDSSRAGRLHELYEEICVDDDRLRQGLEERLLAVDVRLRDALREIATGSATLQFPCTTRDEIAHAVDRSVLDSGELVRLQRRVDELAARTTRLGIASRSRAGRL